MTENIEWHIIVFVCMVLVFLPCFCLFILQSFGSSVIRFRQVLHFPASLPASFSSAPHYSVIGIYIYNIYNCIYIYIYIIVYMYIVYYIYYMYCLTVYTPHQLCVCVRACVCVFYVHSPYAYNMYEHIIMSVAYSPYVCVNVSVILCACSFTMHVLCLFTRSNNYVLTCLESPISQKAAGPLYIIVPMFRCKHVLANEFSLGQFFIHSFIHSLRGFL